LKFFAFLMLKFVSWQGVQGASESLFHSKHWVYGVIDVFHNHVESREPPAYFAALPFLFSVQDSSEGNPFSIRVLCGCICQRGFIRTCQNCLFMLRPCVLWMLDVWLELIKVSDSILSPFSLTKTGPGDCICYRMGTFRGDFTWTSHFNSYLEITPELWRITRRGNPMGALKVSSFP
jgi:hypothetical protein